MPPKGTTVIIAHRISTVRHADNTVVKSHGHIIEQGDLKGHRINMKIVSCLKKTSRSATSLRKEPAQEKRDRKDIVIASSKCYNYCGNPARLHWLCTNAPIRVIEA